jgi:ankyrin repeat protein
VATQPLSNPKTHTKTKIDFLKERMNEMRNMHSAIYNNDLQGLANAITPENINDRCGVTSATALYVASSLSGREEFVKLLIQRGADIDNGNNKGNTPLLVAIKRNCYATVEILLKAGANIFAINDSGFTPLVRSLISRNYPCSKLLIDRGARVEFFFNYDAFSHILEQFITTRNSIRQTAITMISTHRKSQLIHNGKDALRLIAKHIWSMRMGVEK